MHVGRSYRLVDFAVWSRRGAIYVLIVSLVAVAAYSLPPLAGFSIPWPIVAVLGTSVALVAGFKNGQVLQRSSDALQAFAQIAAISRLLASLSCDFLDKDTARRVIRRHLAWLTALRFSLRRPMPWETVGKGANRAFRRRYYQIQEDLTTLPQALTPLLGADADAIAARSHAALALLQLQGEEVNALLKAAADGPLKNILGYEERPLVSIDYRTDPRSSIVDALSTMVVAGTQVKIYAWYDNEWGYVNRTAELVKLVGRADR